MCLGNPGFLDRKTPFSKILGRVRLMSQNGGRPLHERITPLGWIRRPIRAAFFKLFKKALQTEDGKAIAASALKGLLHPRHAILDGAQSLPAPPFAELGKPLVPAQSLRRKEPIFITGRF